MQTPIPEIIFQSIGTALVSGLLSFLGALAVFRARLTAMDVERNAFEKQVERDREHDKELLAREMVALRETIARSCTDNGDAFKRIERRQIAELEMTAAVAVKQGVKHRSLPDFLARHLGEPDDVES